MVRRIPSDVTEEIWTTRLRNNRGEKREVVTNILNLSVHIPFHEESIVYPEFLSIVCLIGPWLSRARIIRLWSSEAEFMNEWPELHLLRLCECIEHGRDAARKTLLVLLIWRTIAIGVNPWLVLDFDKVVPSELAELERLEEEVQTVS